MKNFWFLAFLTWLFSQQAHANIGVPTIMVFEPILIILLIPVIFIEYGIMRKSLKGLTPSLILKATSIANLRSTILGFPLAWFVMLLPGLLTGGGGIFHDLDSFWKCFLEVACYSAWLLPWENEFYWMVPSAFLFLLIPFFLLSCRIEEAAAFRYLKKTGVERSVVKSAVWKANIGSYVFLTLGAIIFLLYSVHHTPTPTPRPFIKPHPIFPTENITVEKENKLRSFTVE